MSRYGFLYVSAYTGSRTQHLFRYRIVPSFSHQILVHAGNPQDETIALVLDEIIPVYLILHSFILNSQFYLKKSARLGRMMRAPAASDAR